MRLIFSYIMFLPIVAFSQEEATSYLGFNNESLQKAFSVIEQTYDVRFSYQDSYIENIKITLINRSRTLDVILDEISSKTKLTFNRVNERYIIITKNSASISDLQALDDIIINGYLTQGIKKQKDASYALNLKELKLLPGLVEPDVLESIQQLPGVISANETASNFNVRGGVSDQNRMIWDGINMYHKGHMFGMISAFNPRAIKNVKFINRGTHPKYGERISSVIDILTEKNIHNDIKAELGINALNADALISMPILKDKLSIQGSIRRSFTEWYTTYTFNQLAEKVFQNTRITEDKSSENNFNFLDYNLKLNYHPNRNNKIYASIISIENTLDYSSASIQNTQTFNDVLEINNTGYGIGWDKKWNSNISQHSNAYFSKYKLQYNFITNDNAVQISDFDKRNVVFDSGISTELKINLKGLNTLLFGYQYVLKDVSYAFLNTANLSFILDSDKSIIEAHNFYGNYNYKNSKLFNFSIGFRASYFKNLDAIRFEPRLLLYKSIYKDLKLQVSAEIKNQVISEIDETVFSDLSLENKLWRLADGETFPIINSQQASIGLIYNKNGWIVDIDHYYKAIDNISALSLGFLNPQANGFSNGKQKIVGVDLFFKKSISKNLNTWLSYTYSSVKNKYEGINDNVYFVSNSNIRHSFSTSITYDVNDFEIALGWKWRTGKPFTQGTVTNDGIVFNNGINTEVLPNYHRLDLSSTYSFKVSNKNKLNGMIGLSFRNLYNKKNHLSKEYSGNNNLNDPIQVVDKFSIGFTPNVLFRLTW